MKNPSKGPLLYNRRGHRIDDTNPEPWRDEDVNRVVLLLCGATACAAVALVLWIAF